MREVRDLHAQQLVGRVARDLAHDPVHHGEVSVRSQISHPRRRQLECDAVQLLAAAQGSVGRFALTDIARQGVASRAC